MHENRIKHHLSQLIKKLPRYWKRHQCALFCLDPIWDSHPLILSAVMKDLQYFSKFHLRSQINIIKASRVRAQSWHMASYQLPNNLINEIG